MRLFCIFFTFYNRVFKYSKPHLPFSFDVFVKISSHFLCNLHLYWVIFSTFVHFAQTAFFAPRALVFEQIIVNFL